MLKEMFDEWHEILGWIGTAMILMAYAAVSWEIMLPESLLYQGLNIVGSGLLTYMSLKVKDFPLVFLNAAWALIGVSALLKVWF